MPSYLYKAKNASAQTVTGRISAQNQDEAFDAIHHQGYVPVSIEEENAQGKLVSEIRVRRIKSKEIYMFTKQLSGLIKSGVPLLRGLEVIAAQTRNQYLMKVLTSIILDVKSGRAFSSALSDYPAIFSPLYVSMIHAGEEMGHLREVLADISQFQKRQEEMASKIKGALVYPVVMLFIGGATVFFILTFVMPKIAAIFTGAGQKLPTPTVIVMSISQFLQVFWMPVLGFAAIGVIIIQRWAASAMGRTMIGRWLLYIPGVRDLVIKANLARFARTMHLLLEHGLSLVRSIEVSAPTVRNPQMKAEIFMCADGINAGENLGSCLNRCVFIPQVFAQVISVAEESGALEDSLRDIAESCESDVNDAVKAVTTLLEPLMILGVGLVVAFIVFAMLLPIFSMDIMAS